MARLVVLGGGESGFGAAVLGKVKGWDVFLSDFGTLPDCYREKLLVWEIPFEEGGHTIEKLLTADLVVKSPGIPDSAPTVREIRKNGIKIISEIEFAGRYTDAKKICITGSNGKTTTTALTYEILKRAGYNVALGGNIGKSFAYSVATGKHDWYVLEISSFQLDGMYDFKAEVAVLMNITPDHLDRYDYKMENYAASKLRIIRNQRMSDYFIYCADDQVTKSEVSHYEDMGALRMKVLPFSVTSCPTTFGACVKDGQLWMRVDSRKFFFDADRVRIRGYHNACNAMAASMAAMAAGVPDDVIAETLAAFGGVEHRLEDVETIGGVTFINDSKATNVDAVWYGMESMTRPVVWIAGGTDKGNDYTPLKDFARTKVKALVCMGVNNAKLISNFTGVVPAIRNTHSLEEAMDTAVSLAGEGDVVLLSPACASFDLFKNYEDRGRQFKDWVRAYRRNQESRGKA